MTSSDAELTHEDPSWWRQAVAYQVGPRSFVDSVGDGPGDVRGVMSSVRYSRDLGIDTVWLSLFCASAFADGGCDVDDYRNDDPRLGSLNGIDDMVAVMQAAGISVFIDIVAHHSCSRDERFQAALAPSPVSREPDRYLCRDVRDGRGERGELLPNDWPSHVSPSARTRTTSPDRTADQWYLHLFATGTPHLPMPTWFVEHPVALLEDDVVLSSVPLTSAGVAGESTIWFRT